MVKCDAFASEYILRLSDEAIWKIVDRREDGSCLVERVAGKAIAWEAGLRFSRATLYRKATQAEVLLYG